MAQKLAAQKEIEFFGDIEKVGKTFEKIKNCDKLKQKQLKGKFADFFEKRAEHKDRQLDNWKKLKSDNRSMKQEMEEKDKMKAQLLDELHNAIVEDTEQKREIQLLKKKDQ